MTGVSGQAQPGRTGTAGAPARRDGTRASGPSCGHGTDGAGEQTGADEQAEVALARAAELARARPATLDDHDLLEHAAAWEEVAAWVAARQLDALAEFARRPAGPARADDDPAALSRDYAPRGTWAREFADDELAARLRLSRPVAHGRIWLACRLERLPATRAALADGRYDLRRAHVVAEEVAALDAGTARAVEASVVDRGACESAPRLRARVRRAVLAVDPVAAEARGRRARAERRVGVFPREDGMADLHAVLAAADAMAIDTAIGAAARAQKATGAEGTVDQLRADALVAPFLQALATGELAGAAPTALAGRRGGRAQLEVTVAASTLLGLDDAPAALRGYGPVTAAVARELAPDARWRRILTEPRSGTVLDVGTTLHRPPAALQRHVEVRDATCRFPGCAWPATACDLDHTVPFPEGPTAEHNLIALCRRHHRFKHAAGVSVVRDLDGTVRWTLPSGHRHDVALPQLTAPHQPDAACADSPASRDLGLDGDADGSVGVDNGDDSGVDTDVDTAVDARLDAGAHAGVDVVGATDAQRDAQTDAHTEAHAPPPDSG